jgi:hypothetical protein
MLCCCRICRGREEAGNSALLAPPRNWWRRRGGQSGGELRRKELLPPPQEQGCRRILVVVATAAARGAGPQARTCRHQSSTSAGRPHPNPPRVGQGGRRGGGYGVRLGFEARARYWAGVGVVGGGFSKSGRGVFEKMTLTLNFRSFT